MDAMVLHNDELELKDLGNGCARKVLSYSKDIMMVEVHFAEGARGDVHSHPHTQCTYVRSGLFEFSVNGENVIVGPGDSLCFAPNISHGSLCLEAGILIDCFTPAREDFLKA